MTEQTPSKKLDRCPACGGELTFGYGLAGGGDQEGNPTGYTMCLDCDWQSSSPRPGKARCFPFGVADKDPCS